MLLICGSEVVDLIAMALHTGLSSLALLRSLPGKDASVTGVDLSPHFLAVGRWEQQRREVGKSKSVP